MITCPALFLTGVGKLMTRDFYLNPVGLLYGSTAQEAIGSGSAGRLAGGDIGFSAVELLPGPSGAIVRDLRSYQDLRSSQETNIIEALRLLEDKRSLPGSPDHSGPLIMGVVNVTPDSFSDGGDFLEANVAIAHGRALAKTGADILDIGGESTRPGAEPISMQEELNRILPVVEGLATLSRPLSIDTRRSEVMRQAVTLGAHYVNDVSALTFEENSLEVARQLDRPVILMHAQGDPRTMQDDPVYDNVVLEVFNWLAQRLEMAQNAGIKRKNLLIDPGIGFGKNLNHNLQLLANLAFFHGAGVPIVVGASRKRFIGALSNVSDARHRMPGSIAAALKAAASGVQIIRVHDVAETRQALSVVNAIQAT
jgi:dihydropteroate synthase